MEYIGIDVHQRECRVCILDSTGQVMLERRVGTSRERFAALLGRRLPARVLLEAATESEWVAQALEALGHEVVVADPNFAPMYATRSRRVKTDRRDARTLADACRLGAYRPAHRTSAAQRVVRAQLAVRDAPVQTRPPGPSTTRIRKNLSRRARPCRSLALARMDPIPPTRRTVSAAGSNH